MLNEEARKKAEDILNDILQYKKEGINPVIEYEIDFIEWLAKTLIEMDDRIYEHSDCCLTNRPQCAYRKKTRS